MPARRAPLAPLVVALLLVATLAAAAYLRFAGLARLPFWLDEAYSAYAADHDWRFLWRVVPTYETHPPFYYSLVHLWVLAFGDGLLALRMPGALCGLAVVPVMALVGREMARALELDPVAKRWLIVALAALAALQPNLVLMSRQVRPYALMSLVYAASLIPLMRIAAARPALPRAPLAGFALCEALMLWLHSLGPLFAGAMGLALLAVVDLRALGRRGWAWLAGSQLAAIAVWLPGALILADQAPTWVHSTWLVFDPRQLWPDIGLLYATPNIYARVRGLLLAAVGFALLAVAPRRRPVGDALLRLALVPTLASLAITLTLSPVFLTRTLAAVAMPALAIMACGVALAGRFRWLMLLPLVSLVSFMWRSDHLVLTNPPSEDWYGAVDFLRARVRPGDELWFYPNESALPFVYAARDRGFHMAMRSIPTIVPSENMRGNYPTGSRGVVSLFPDDIAKLAASPQACAPRTLWLLRTGPWTYDPGDVMLKALSAHREQIDDWQVEPIEIEGLRRTRPC